MTIKTSQILMQIAALQARIAMLSDAQNQITKCQSAFSSLSAQLTPDTEPDAASLAFAQSQISASSATLQTAATALGVAVAAPVSAQLNTAAPASAVKIGS